MGISKGSHDKERGRHRIHTKLFQIRLDGHHIIRDMQLNGMNLQIGHLPSVTEQDKLEKNEFVPSILLPIC